MRIARSGRSAHTEGWCHVASTRTIERTKDDATLVIREFKRERGKIIVDAEAWTRGELTHAAQFPLLDQRESAHFVVFAG